MNTEVSMTRSMFAVALLAALAGAPGLAMAQTAAAPAAVAAQPSAQPATQPTAQPADLFDFWLGDWQLSWLNADGSKGTGRNRITKILDGAVIQEDFEALTGSPPPLLKGRSLSMLAGGTWRQSWVDNQGGYFTFTAQVDDAKRVFISAPRPLNDGSSLLQRMVFGGITPQSITWDWQSSTDGGKTWLLQWRIVYSR